MKPILYSFRRCPYAIRARMILDLCSIDFCLREVALSNKPKEMLKASPKGTVPILILPQKKVLDESMDIVFWALKKTSKTDKKFLEWLDEDLYGRSMQLIDENDNKFKVLLDKYKYCRDKKLAVKYRQEAKSFLYRLNELLSNQLGLCKNEITFSDICIFPFVRQFAFVDYEWFLNCKLDNLNDWLQKFLNSELFKKVMQKHAIYEH